MFWGPMDDPGITLPHLTPQTVVGISVAIAGNMLISLALNLQKLAHLRLDHEREGSPQDVERESGPPRRDPNAKHTTRPDTPSRLGAAPQTLEENQQFETRPLLPRSLSQPLPSSYGLSHHSIPVAGDDTRSQKSSIAALSRRRQRKHTFVSRFLPLPSTPWGNSSASSSSRPDHSGSLAIPIMGEYPQQNTQWSHQDNGKASSPDTLKDGKESDYLRSRLWWLGFVLMNIGETGNFISYAFAPASLVAPLGTFALVANCFFAPLLLNEHFRLRDVFGILLAIIGATTVVLSSPSSGDAPPVLTPEALIEAISQRPFVIFSIMYLVSAIILGGLSEGSMGKRTVVIDIGLCAIFGGFTVLATKAISTLLTKEWVKMMAEWITYPILAVLVLTGVLQIRYLNRALKRFDSKIVIPTQFVFFTLSAVIGSAVLYGDFRRASFHEMLTFLYGCAATFAGVFVIASGPNGNMSESVRDEERHDAGGRWVATSRIDGVGSLETQSHPAQGTQGTGAREIPALRHKPSTISLVGYTPVQSFLLAHTPPRDRVAHRGREREGR